MGRAKRKLELMSNPKERYRTFFNRMESLKKKACELKTLCNIEVCLIVQNEPKLDKLDSNPIEEIWPSDRDVIKQLITSYEAQPVDIRLARSVGLEILFKSQTKKMEKEIIELKGKNKMDMYPTWDARYNVLPKDQLEEFGRLLDEKLQYLKTELETMRRNKQIAVEKKIICSIKSETGSSYNDNQIYAENSEAKLETKVDPCYTQLEELNCSGEFSNFDHFLNPNSEDYLGF